MPGAPAASFGRLATISIATPAEISAQVRIFYQSIARAAIDYGADVLVLGTRGRAGYSLPAEAGSHNVEGRGFRLSAFAKAPADPP